MKHWDNLCEFVDNQNARNGLFKLQFNLGHILTVVGLLAVVIPMWVGQISNDAEARHALLETKESLHAIQAETKVSLQEIKTHLDSIDKTTTMSLVDDDRLLRVQQDIKEIETRISAIETRMNQR